MFINTSQLQKKKKIVNKKKKNEQYITYLAIYFAISFYERLLLEI